MIPRVRRCDVDNPEEVTKVFNRIIDHLNEAEIYNDEVEAYNDGLIGKDKE